MYAKFYRKDDFADCKVVLIPEDTPEPNTSKYPDGSRKEPGHCVLLCGKSAVLDAKLQTPVGRGRSKSTTGKKRCYIQLEPSSWDPFVDIVMYHMYHDALPEGLSHGQLLEAARLADRLQVPTCLKSCNEQLQAIAADDLDWDGVHVFYSMPDTLREGVLKEAGEVFEQRLRATYRCFEEAWRDPELRDTFLQLPLGAVEALAAMDELQVVSENTVALALASWLAAHETRLVAGPALLEHLRLQHLSQCYLGDVLPKLPGLGSNVSMQQMFSVAQYLQATDKSRKAAKLDGSMKAARALARSSKLSFSWRVRTAEVVEVIERRLGPEQAHGVLRSEYHAYNGFAISMKVEAATSNGKAPYLYIYAAVCAPLAAPGGSTGSGKQLPVRAADLTASIKMPAEAAAEGAMRSFNCNKNRIPSTKEVRTSCRNIKLGEGAVVDAKSLLAALVSKETDVMDVAQPVTDINVALMPELVFECSVSSCV